MSSKPLLSAFAAVLAVAAAAAAGTALAQQHRQLPSIAAPQAVAQTLGMAIMSAQVGYDGTLTGGAGTIGATRKEKGRYFVAFNRSVEGCTYTGAVSGPTAFIFPGFVTSMGKSDTLAGATYYGVQVDTSDHDARIEDRPFHLLVFCSK